MISCQVSFCSPLNTWPLPFEQANEIIKSFRLEPRELFLREGIANWSFTITKTTMCWKSRGCWVIRIHWLRTWFASFQKRKNSPLGLKCCRNAIGKLDGNFVKLEKGKDCLGCIRMNRHWMTNRLVGHSSIQSLLAKSDH